MKRYNGAAAEKIATREQLPVGGYEVKIINAKEEVFDWGTKLVIASALTATTPPKPRSIPRDSQTSLWPVAWNPGPAGRKKAPSSAPRSTHPSSGPKMKWPGYWTKKLKKS